MTIFEDFLEYCEDDNKRLVKNIKIWLADFFDLPNRTIILSKEEKTWIKDNLSEENQRDILGYTIKEFNEIIK